MKKTILLWVILVNAWATIAFAAPVFLVKKIEIVGLQRISEATVMTYLPIRTGQVLKSDNTTAIINALYATGFFDYVSLSREGNTLVVHVAERPTIGQLKISGNNVIPKDKLNEVIRSVNIAEGRIYDRVILDKIKQSLLNQYYQLGRYNARVDVNVSPMSRNRVLVEIKISEGLIAKVRGINIIGNSQFDEKLLDKKLALSTPNLFTLFTQKDRFSQEKLDASLDSLRNFYLDHGYLRFTIKSSQVEITPDRKAIFITIVIFEGDPYTVKGHAITGNLILPRDELEKLIKIPNGSVFTRQSIVDSEKAISEALGNKGYISADVMMRPEIDDNTKQVFLVFIVKPGRLTYVRHIYFANNTKTNDVVLRREMTQMESALATTTKLQESKHRLLRLPYVKEAEMAVKPVETSEDPLNQDQVDVEYKVTEESAAAANFNVGYSQLDHVFFGAGLNQKNFLGTGNTLGFNLMRSRYQQYYGISYINPYYTVDGVSRSTTFSLSKFDPKWTGTSQDYTTNQYSFMDVFSFPLGFEQGVYNRLQLGYGYENTLLHLIQDKVQSEQITDFVNQHGRHFEQIDLIVGLSRDTRDRYIFPTSGMFHSLTGTLYLPAQKDGLSYYIFDYNTRFYHPLPYNFVATARGEIGYGNSFTGPTNFPFYKNFYAGGIDSVRGFDDNTLGPRDSNNDPTGGNFLVDSSLGLIFPNHISENLRTSVFIDGGNTYDTFNNEQFNGTNGGPIRFSSGVEADWLTPMGLIAVSYARPLNSQGGDHDDFFQFRLGANFG